MSAKAILTARPNSFRFSDRVIDLDVPIKIGRAFKNEKSDSSNAYFDCKVTLGGKLPSSLHAKIQQYFGPNGPTASIFYGIWIEQSGAMVCIFNLDKVSLKKLFPTMNI